MFNKFKNFSFIFIFCMSIFGVTAFAEDRALGLDDNKYYVSYVGSQSGTSVLYTFNSYDDSFGFVISDNVREYHKIDGVYVLKNTPSSVRFSDFSFISNFDTNHSELYFDFISNGVDFVGSVPPAISPTVGEAIAKIPADLSEQLKILLPVGVTILSILLGVSLIPRLVRLFR